MNLLDCMGHPELRKRVKSYKKGLYLFNQGQQATTMFIILEGRVHLTSDGDSGQNVISILETGQFLGEKAILKSTPYQRAYSALAVVDTTVLELSLKDLEDLQKTSPPIVIDILKQVLYVVEDRFDRANYMIRLLRSSNNVERLVHCILYICRVSGKKFKGGTEVILNPDSIHHYIDMEPKRIEASLKELARQHLIVPTGDGRYLVPSETSLLGYIPDLIYRLAA